MRKAQGDLQKLLGAYTRKKGQRYDCVVGLNGSPESSYLALMLVKQYGLRPLAVTVDNGFMLPASLQRARFVTRRLGLDHKVIKLSSLFKIVIKYALLNDFFSVSPEGRACEFCAALFRNVLYKQAVEAEVPFLTTGNYNRENPQLLFDIEKAVDLSKSLPASLCKIVLQNKAFYSAFGKRGNQVLLPQAVCPLNTVRYSDKMSAEALKSYFKVDHWQRFVSFHMYCDIGFLTTWLHKRLRGYFCYNKDISYLIRQGVYNKQEWGRILEAADKVMQSRAANKKVLRILNQLKITPAELLDCMREGA